MKCGLYLKLGWRTHLPFAFRTTALCWLCCDESLVREDICCGVQTDASQHRHHFGLSQPAPAAPSLNRAETYSHPCLLINTETSSKANSFWQRCQGPMLTSSPVFNWAEFLRPLSLPYLATSPCFAHQKHFLIWACHESTEGGEGRRNVVKQKVERDSGFWRVCNRNEIKKKKKNRNKCISSDSRWFFQQDCYIFREGNGDMIALEMVKRIIHYLIKSPYIRSCSSIGRSLLAVVFL